jgi:death on curing protein
MAFELRDPEWIAYEVVLSVHEAQLAEHGGSAGIRDQGLLESALMRPRNVHLYSPGATLYDLAAAYAIGLAKNHAFVDGNKRTAWLACALFLELNGINVIASQESVVITMLRVADGSINEDQLSAWLQLPDVTVKGLQERC